MFDNLGTDLSFSSSFHLQTNGQSEITNSTFLDLLKFYIHDHQMLWEKYLSIVEFTYNNTIHSSIGKTPFEIIYGRSLPTPLMQTKEWIFAADQFVEDYDSTYASVHTTIHKAQGK